MSRFPGRPGVPAVLAGVGLLLILLPACGRKGSPLPPRTTLPRAVSSLQADPGESAIVVTWTRPERNQDSTPLRDLREFRLFRAVEGAPYSLLATIPAIHPDNATEQSGQYTFRDTGGLAPGLR